MAAPAGSGERRLPATVDGLFRAPCDPVVLAVGDDGRLGSFGALLDWRLAGRLARHVSRNPPTPGSPLLVPGSALLPAARFVLFARSTPLERAVVILSGLGLPRPGICPDEFGWSGADVAAAFGDVPVVLFSAVPG